MKALITGGSGFIGSALARRLVGDGHEVVVLDDMSRGARRRLPGCTLIEGDIRDEDAVLAAVHGCDTVIHMAYVNGTETFYAEPRHVLDVAVRGMSNVLYACEAMGCSDLMLISSSEAYQVPEQVPTPETVPLSVPDPLNPRYSYGGGKIISELMAMAWQRTGVLDRAVVVRPHNIFGPDGGRDHVIPQFCLRMARLDREHPEGVIPFPVQGTGTESRSFCYIDDCTDQLALLLERGDTGIWHVGTMDERAIAYVAHDIAKCFGREIKIEPGTLRKGSPPQRCPDTAKIAALGYRPQVSFREGLKRTVEWYRASG